jgi:hypothetical protein
VYLFLGSFVRKTVIEMIVSTKRPNDNNRRTGGSRRRVTEHQFTNYLSFGPVATICVGIYLFAYIIVMAIFSPLLEQESPKSWEYVSEIKPGYVLNPVINNVKQLTEKEGGIAGALRKVAEKEANVLKQKLHNFRLEQNITDHTLLENAKNEMNLRIKLRKEQQRQLDPTVTKNSNKNVSIRNGFIVLGMHRSGTSMLSGLLVNGLGYNVGAPLIGSKFDNKKGFFELIPVVLQNDEFFYLQDMYWASGIVAYNDTLALQHLKNGDAKFEKGRNALQFLNSPNSVPYLQKDPRMCITLQTWIPLLNHEPAILFTYRHPVEVAMSLHKRERDISISQGLRIWIVYNMKAIQNSKGLCIVYTSNEAVIANPFSEVQRLSDELTTKCKVPKPNQTLTQQLVDTFVDTKLQHGKDNSSESQQQRKVLATVGKDCKIYEFISGTPAGSDEYEYEQTLYSAAMKVYCDLKSGEAYKSYYDWPSVDTYNEYPTNDDGS